MSIRPNAAGEGIVAMLIASIAVVAVAFFGKIAIADFNPVQISFFKNLFGLLPAAALVIGSTGPSVLRTSRPASHWFNGLATFAALVGYFGSLAYLPVPTAVVLSLSYPLFMSALSAPILGEKVSRRNWIAIFVGFLGVVIVMQPEAMVWNPGYAIGMGSALLTAVCWINVRRISDTESTAAVTVSTTVVPLIASAIVLPWFWHTPSLSQSMILAAIGLVGGLSQIAISHAYRSAAPSVVLPFYYLQIVWAGAISWLLLSDVPSLREIVGNATIIFAGLYIALRPAFKARG